MEILDIFYNYIIKEASEGKVKCFFTYSILFDTVILDSKATTISEDNNYLYPTLTIHNKEEFDKLLIEYVNLCLNFYSTKDFKTEVLNCENYNKDRTCPEKLILSLLWANATYDDFLEPEEYLKKRISFIKNTNESYFYTDYSNMLDGNVMFTIEKDKLFNETPYKINISFISKNNDYNYLPEIKFGIYNDKVYIYAIQNFIDLNNDYSKKINRILYKIGEGFDSKTDNYEIYGEGNLKDVTSSFVIALNMAISYFHEQGFRNIEVPSFLPIRWNSKNLVLERKVKEGKFGEEEKIDVENKIVNIQKNITDKYIRTFLRLAHHYEGINITSLPLDIDNNLHISLSDELNTNNKLLEETKNLVVSRSNVKSI